MKISAVYIAKNEEANIARSLESVKAAVDELILVDTGSKDRTKEIFSAYGGRIYEIPWQEDFAQPRNLALAKATGEWIILLDADEYFSTETCQNLHNILVQNSKADGLLVQIINQDSQTGKEQDRFYQLRAVRRQKGLAYHGRIHEELRLRGKNLHKLVQIPAQDLQIIHTGYSQELSELKARRNLNILKQEIAEGRPEAELYRYLCECYNGLGDKQLAEYYAWLDIKQGRKQTSYSSQCYRFLLKELGKKIDADSCRKRLKLVRQAVEEYPEVPDFHAEYGACLMYWYCYQEAAAELLQALQLAENYHGLEPCLLDAEALVQIESVLQQTQQLAQQAAKVKLSVCVITKNEECNLPLWLENVRHFADEIIIADTGSEDSTVQVAQNAGIQPYTLQWQDDFAAAKNYAINKATGDWIVFLDADQTFLYPEAVRGYLGTLSQKKNFHAVFMPEYNVDIDMQERLVGINNVIRVFRNLPQLRYTGMIHEQLSLNGCDDAGMSFARADYRLAIRHTGYSTGIVQQKIQRNLKLLERELAHTTVPEKYYYYLADCFFGLGEYQLALDNALLAIQSDYQPRGQQGDMYYLALQSMERLQYPWEDMLAVADAGIRALPLLPDFNGYKGILLQMSAQNQQAIEYLEQSMKLYQHYREQGDAEQASHFALLLERVQVALGKCYLQLKDITNARTWFLAVMQVNIWRDDALAGFVDTYKEPLDEQLIEKLSKLYGDKAESRNKCLELLELHGFRQLSVHLQRVWHKAMKDGVLSVWYNELDTGMYKDNIMPQLQMVLHNMQYLCVSLMGQVVDASQEITRKQIELLQSELQDLVRCYHKGQRISEDAFATYQLVLPSIIIFGDKDILKQYLALGENLSPERKMTIADALWQSDRPEEALEFYSLLSVDEVADNGDYWFKCGRAFYAKKNYASAAVCLTKAWENGYTGNELEAYTAWCQEALRQ